ncbi:MAG: ABC transporter ATP-binding protein [Methanobacteriota archaeon]
MPSIELRKVAKRFGPVTAAEDVNLKVADKEYVTILGPSGCGKTTLVKIISGIWDPTEGEAFIDDKKMENTPTCERDVGYVFQNIALFPHMSVMQNVTYSPIVKGKREKAGEIASAMMSRARLEGSEGKMPGELSGGAQQKVGIARALASESKIVIFDEPLSALDARVRVSLRYELRRYVKELGLTAVHVTHDQEEAMSVSDRIVLMRAGRIIEEGTPSDLYEKPKSLFTANFIGEMNFIEGTVVERHERYAVVIARNGTVIRALDEERNFLTGSPVVVACRPENCSISSDGPGMPGTMAETTFMGSFTRYRARLLSGEDIAVDAHTETRTFNRGEAVRVDMDPDRCLVYQTPREGLAEVLKLE